MSREMYQCYYCGRWIKPAFMDIGNSGLYKLRPTCPACRRKKSAESKKLFNEGVQDIKDAFGEMKGDNGSDDSKSSSKRSCGCGCLLVVIILAVLAAIGALSEKKEGSEAKSSQVYSVPVKVGGLYINEDSSVFIGRVRL